MSHKSRLSRITTLQAEPQVGRQESGPPTHTHTPHFHVLRPQEDARDRAKSQGCRVALLSSNPGPRSSNGTSRGLSLIFSQAQHHPGSTLGKLTVTPEEEAAEGTHSTQEVPTKHLLSLHLSCQRVGTSSAASKLTTQLRTQSLEGRDSGPGVRHPSRTPESLGASPSPATASC